MFIFNTTFSVNNARVDEWRNWIGQNYLPMVGAMMITNGVEIFEVMMAEQDNSRTFSVQWRCLAPDHLEAINQTTNRLHNQLAAVFGEDCLHFSTILKEFDID
jgi:hypothetical protein